MKEFLWRTFNATTAVIIQPRVAALANKQFVLELAAAMCKDTSTIVWEEIESVLRAFEKLTRVRRITLFFILNTFFLLYLRRHVRFYVHTHNNTTGQRPNACPDDVIRTDDADRS